MPPPDVCLILVVTTASIAAYLLWILDAAPRLRGLLIFVTVVAVVAVVIVHDVEMANIVAEDIAPDAHGGGPS